MGRNGEIKKIALTGIVINILLAVFKIGGGVWFGSTVILAVGLDSLFDVFSYFLTYLCARWMDTPANKKFPFGLYKLETLASKILSIIIIIVGVQLIIQSISSLSSVVYTAPQIDAVFLIALISAVVKILFNQWQKRKNRTLNSTLIKASILNMQSDIVALIPIAIGLGIQNFYIIPRLDAYLSLFVASWIIYNAFHLFLKTSYELIDRVPDEDLYQQVIKAAEKVKGVENPHRIRIRRVAERLMIDIDIEVDGNLTVNESHQIGVKVEEEIKNSIPSVYDIMLHVEPIGNHEEDEKFGVSKWM